MKLGEIRKTDANGRIQLPKDMREHLGIEVDIPLNVYLDGDKIIITRIGSPQ